MFCPSCGRQNQDNAPFCAYCGNALPQQKDVQNVTKSKSKQSSIRQKGSSSKIKISFTAIKAIVTVLLLIGVTLVILQLYYPGFLPWN